MLWGAIEKVTPGSTSEDLSILLLAHRAETGLICPPPWSGTLFGEDTCFGRGTHVGGKSHALQLRTLRSEDPNHWS